jgi:hypothetical protein
MILRNVKFDFNETWIFRGRFSKNTQISNFMKIRPVGAWFSRADGRTDMKLVVALRNFANAPKERPQSVIWLPLPSMITVQVQMYRRDWAYVDTFLSSMDWLRNIGTSHYRNEETVIWNRDFVCACLCLKLCLIIIQYSVQHTAQSVINNLSRMWQIIIDYAICWIKYRIICLTEYGSP